MSGNRIIAHHIGNFSIILSSESLLLLKNKTVYWRRYTFDFKHLCQSFLFNKVAAPATLLKKRLWHRCFPVNFAKFLRTPFFTEHLWWLLLCAMKFYFWKNVFFYWYKNLAENIAQFCCWTSSYSSSITEPGCTHLLLYCYCTYRDCPEKAWYNPKKETTNKKKAVYTNTYWIFFLYEKESRISLITYFVSVYI